MSNLSENTRKYNAGKIVPELVVMLCAALLSTIGLEIFVYPNSFAPTGVDGIVAMLYQMFGWNTGILTAIISLPLVVASYFFLGKEYAVKCLIYTVMSTAILTVSQATGFLARFAYKSTVEDSIVPAIYSGVILGVRVGLMLRIGSSTGGIDIISGLINKKRPNMNVEWIIFLISVVTAICSFFVYNNGLTPILLSIIFSFISSKTAEFIVKGGKEAVQVTVITDSPDEVKQEILKFHGATSIDAKGCYTDTDKTVIICLINRRQTGDFEKIIRKYPHTFVYFSDVTNVIGNFVRGKNKPLK